MTVYFPEDKDLMLDERDNYEGKLIVNHETIQLKIVDDFNKQKEIFKLHYTINCPKVDISQTNTRLISLNYEDKNRKAKDEEVKGGSRKSVPAKGYEL